jgi:2',3'-cyclic-nucleotide 2'-phosphodiesterase / 3'-nucleotidase
VAALIAAARAEVGNCLYVDNGDLIEGNPLADHQVMARPGSVHPMIAALNALGCDAATLGNHEFSHGMAFLRRALADARYPVVSANILTRRGARPGDDDTLVAPYVILDRMVADQTGVLHPLRVGVFGLTPPQVLDWDGARIGEPLAARDMLEAAAHAMACLRAAGADLVVALAHTGLGGVQMATGAENVGVLLAALPGLDALVLGHAHQVFPSPDFAACATIDLQRGTVHGTPTVMPGTHGSHLGVIDLTLIRDAGRWRVCDGRAAARPIALHDATGQAQALVADDPGLLALAAPAHQAVRDWMAQPIGQTAVTLHSFFALVADAPMQRLIAAAQAQHLRRIIADTPMADLPVLSAVAPFKTGGRGGATNFTHVPAGPLLMRHVSDLYTFPNTFAAVMLTGAEVATWLERAVSAYARLDPDTPDQVLLDPVFPGFGIEMIAGVTYTVDLAAPARYDVRGDPVGPGQGRIRDLCFAGRAIDPDARFALATNSYRVGVMRSVCATPPRQIATGSNTMRDILRHQIAAHRVLPAAPPPSWRLRPLPGTSVVIDTGPDAVAYLDDIARFHPQDLGLTERGFRRFRLHL